VVSTRQAENVGVQAMCTARERPYAICSRRPTR
jgi:hypothetical protein